MSLDFIHRLRLHVRRRAPRRSPGVWVSVLLGVGLAFVLILTFNMRLHPVMVSMATAKVSNAVTQVLDSAVSSQVTSAGMTYHDFITLEKDSQGHITALTSNMSALNSLRTDLLGTVVQAVDGLNSQDLAIPVGNLTGISFLSGRGVNLPVRVISVGIAHATFQNVFSSAGINQTRHQIVLDLCVTVDILLPGETLRTEISAEVCVAETVIVGEVPNTYLQMGTTQP